jgi:hypothetical protein
LWAETSSTSPIPALRKKITKFARLWPSQEAIFLPEEVEEEAHLKDLTVGLETDSIGGEPRWPA